MIGLTGGTGFIGSYLSRGLPNLKRLVRDPDKANRKHDLIGNIANHADLEAFLPQTECLIHLASVNYPRNSNRDFLADLQMNLLPNVYLFERYAQLNPKGHLIFASSGGALYDPALPQIPRREDDPLKPWSAYGIQKQASEAFLRLISARDGLKVSCLRISNPYGTVLPTQRGQGLVGIAISTALQGSELPIYGDSGVIRDYLHLSDLERAVAHCIASPPPETTPYRVLNIGSGRGYTVNQVLQEISSALGKSMKTRQVPVEGLGSDWNILDISRAKTVLDWEPRMELGEGIRRTVAEITS